MFDDAKEPMWQEGEEQKDDVPPRDNLLEDLLNVDED